jgi:dolichyl-phosphate-mannose--protein O-mannosyl transferase
MLVTLRLLEALELPAKARITAMAVVAFHPTFFLLSSSINNDMAMIFFFLTAVLYTVRWYRDPTYKNILLLALAIGRAMSAKFSGALVAVFTAVIFLLALIKKFRAGGGAGLVGQYTAFAAVCLPLSLWHPVRNMLLFGQPLGYVLEIPVKSALYVGDRSFAAGFLSFDVLSLLWGGFCNPWADWRVWEYAV